MSYMNDPREMIFNKESGVMMEQDNRREEIYQWGAMQVDLCNLPVEDYMRPLKVEVIGSTNPETGTTLYKLTFVVDGDEVYTQELQRGDLIPFNEISGEKEGRNFKGWYFGTTQYSEGSKMPGRNLILTAKYECEVSFVYSIDGEETIVSSYTVTYNSKPTRIPSTNKDGYNFIGWEPSTTEPVTAHTTYVGTFEIKKFTVTWSGYTDGPILEEYKYGDTLNVPTKSPEKEGYTFKEWTPLIKEEETVKSNVVYTAKFDINTYKVFFYSELDGVLNEIKTIEVPYNSSLTLINIPVESGFTFENWIGYNAETDEEFNGTNMPPYNLKFVSKKNRNTYVLNYYDNNELVYSENYLYESTIVPFEYEKEGWTVYDWTNLPEKMPYNNVSAHCESVINQYKVTFRDENANIISEVMADYGTIISTLLPYIEGYTYTVSDDILNVKLGSADMVVDGILTINEYDVTIIIDGVTEIVKLPYSTNIIDYVSKNYTPEVGYNMSIDTNNEFVPSNNDTVVTIIYKANEWILSYATNGGDDKDIKGENRVNFGETILDKLPKVEVDGYNFSGWFINDVKVTDTDVMPNNNLSVNGTLSIKTYNIEIKDGDNVVLNKSYNHGTKIEDVLNDEIVLNYVRNSFDNGYIVTFEVNTDELITSDMVIEVTKAEREFVLTFKNGDEVISSETVKFGTTITYPPMENKTEDGVEYVFIWDDASLNGKPMPLRDVLIIGSYQEKPSAPIYYGGFKVAISAYTPDNTTQYLDTSMLETEYYDSIEVSKCVGNGTKIYVPFVADPDMAGMNPVQVNAYHKIWRRPNAVLMPCEVVDKYEIEFSNAIGNRWNAFTTDGQVVTYNGNDYYFYVMYTDDLKPLKTSQTMEYTIKLTNK